MNIDWESEYNNRARVPEHPEIIAQWRNEAAAYREQASCELDIPYGPLERNRLDLFHPASRSSGAGPVHLFIHGGYWQSRDKRDFSHLASGLNARGCTVAMATYSLCPDVDLPTIVSEMWTCTAFLSRRFASSLTISGHSAGGHLVAELLATDWPQIAEDLPDQPVSKGVAVSGLFDLRPLCQTSINEPLGLDETRAMAVSPAFKTPRPGVSLVTVVGEIESSEFHRQCAVIADEWRPQGIDVAHQVVPGANHFTVLTPYTNPDSDLVRACI